MMFSLRDVSFSYPQNMALFTGLNLDLGRAENVVISGDNGSGKSTLLRLLAGVLIPQRGIISACGRQIVRKNPPQGVFYLAQEPQGQLLGCTPKHDLRIWAIAGIDAQNIQDHPLLDVTPKDFLHCPFRELSSGTVQAYMLALGLIAKERFLLLDEPLKSLDQNRREVFLKALGAHQGMVIVSHEPELFAGIATRWIKIESGSLLED